MAPIQRCQKQTVYQNIQTGGRLLRVHGAACLSPDQEGDTEATVTIATSKTQVSAIHNQLGQDVGISVEPCRRDTFPAIALATAYLVDVQKISPEESVVVCR